MRGKIKRKKKVFAWPHIASFGFFEKYVNQVEFVRLKLIL